MLVQYEITYNYLQVQKYDVWLDSDNDFPVVLSIYPLKCTSVFASVQPSQSLPSNLRSLKSPNHPERKQFPFIRKCKIEDMKRNKNLHLQINTGQLHCIKVLTKYKRKLNTLEKAWRTYWPLKRTKFSCILYIQENFLYHTNSWEMITCHGFKTISINNISSLVLRFQATTEELHMCCTSNQFISSECLSGSS